MLSRDGGDSQSIATTPLNECLNALSDEHVALVAQEKTLTSSLRNLLREAREYVGSGMCSEMHNMFELPIIILIGQIVMLES